MFEHLQLSQLAILPGTTHFAPLEQPMLFNAIVDRFFSEPFAMPDTRDIFEIPAQ
jgi:pimeloyl-ACP methyl ester carboxylesterase